ncbi:sulfate ABC transporter substrate-binding protein [Paenibacillus baekrokdamisoli]|uniref:Sulfate ABC transporter substrate-binding protein n=1 Tax=Paenibacillus baekrokdamisoli TaxID=1712516 RepID=A0A3G9IW04_9BACL|nr:ABC transporter substrate-binding protein [Paenibacillus baekrokdamisoli]MBB3067933.1 NitT/TauT family transport system substrate-binding protein [Paenibacillus baekrokdamisoli]BBH23020.1 sulfate ABC transporter substrate-binding protein [Paenibacillus baekrokdamisoli]
MKKTLVLSMVILLFIAILSGCGSANNQKSDVSTASTGATVKIGLLKNVTHAPAFIAIKNGYFQKYFGDNVKIEVQGFNNGSDFSTAMATGQIDIGFVGPSPVINQYVRSRNLKIISGSNNGGAVLVVRKGAGISSVKDLAGKLAAVPTKGSTNEISLRLLLEQQGLKVTTDKSGVQLITMAPADTLVAMKQGQVDAALLPEPWGTQIANEGIGEILVDWDKIPPNDGNYPLTILVASDDFLKDHRDLAKGAIHANLDAIDFIQKNPEETYPLVSDELKELTGKGLDVELIKIALKHLKLTTDVDQKALESMAQVAVDAGYVKGVDKNGLDQSGLIDLSILKEALDGK